MAVDMSRVYIGLGSNAAHKSHSPAQVLHAGLSALRDVATIEVLQVSSLYGTSPVGPQDQPDYVNAVAELAATLSPEPLLDVLQAIEAEWGRDRSVEQRWGQRCLDLDVLLYANQTIQTPRLNIPHVELSRRAFVLYPLVEIAPEVVVPGHGTARQLLARFQDSADAAEQRLHKLAL